MLRNATRVVPRSAWRSPIARVRQASTDSAQRRFAVYQSQTTKPVVYASLGLAALFGWTAAILMVGGQGEKKHSAAHAVKEGEQKSARSRPALLRNLACGTLGVRESFQRTQKLAGCLCPERAGLFAQSSVDIITSQTR